MSGTLRGRRRAIPPNLLSAAALHPTASSASILVSTTTPRSSLLLTPRLTPSTPSVRQNLQLLTPRTPQPQATAMLTPLVRAAMDFGGDVGIPVDGPSGFTTVLLTTTSTTTSVETHTLTLTTVYTQAPVPAVPTGPALPPQQPAQEAQPQPPPTSVAGASEGSIPGAAVPAAAAPTAAAPETNASIGGVGGNSGLLIGVSGAAGLSLLGVAGFLIARRRRMMGANVKLNQNNKLQSRDTLDAVRAQAMAGQLPRPYSSRHWLE